jgi:FkbM family methyltransferase
MRHDGSKLARLPELATAVQAGKSAGGNWMTALQSKLPWSIAFISEWYPHLTMRSILRLRDFELRKKRGDAMAGGLLLTLRRTGKTTITLRETGSDMLTFIEVIKEQVYKDVLSLVPRCEAIVDLGANIGLASLYFASHYSGCRIFAVEPNPSTYALLTSNLAPLIDAGRCRTLNAAVWSRATDLGAAGSVDPNHYSAFATKEVAGESNEGAPKISGLPMSRLLLQSGFQHVDLLKVDIEGAEVELFQGDLSWLSTVRAIAIEFHGESRRLSNFDGIMATYGFKIVDGGSHTVVALKTDWIVGDSRRS